VLFQRHSYRNVHVPGYVSSECLSKKENIASRTLPIRELSLMLMASLQGPLEVFDPVNRHFERSVTRRSPV
jgi:hypothetical protein